MCLYEHSVDTRSSQITVPMSVAISPTGRRLHQSSRRASIRKSMRLIISASSGASGNDAANICAHIWACEHRFAYTTTMYPNCITFSPYSPMVNSLKGGLAYSFSMNDDGTDALLSMSTRPLMRCTRARSGRDRRTSQLKNSLHLGVCARTLTVTGCHWQTWAGVW
jgi:hypothetical protein